GAEAPEFPLNRPEAQGASILVVGRNFGCGSSREHAVWAVAQAGYRAVIAPGKGEGFADIFEGNAYNNGLLPIELPSADWERIVAACKSGPDATIDLAKQTISVHSDPEVIVRFEVSEGQKHRLLKGLDAIGETLGDEAAIAAHEQAMPAWRALNQGV